jgi:uncharacterized protein
MVTQEQIKACAAVARNYGATRVVLFGSALREPERARDIDIACSGVRDDVFIRMSAEMDRAAGRPVDVIDADEGNGFTEYVLRHGMVLYG